MKVFCAWCKKPMDEYATTEAMLSVGADDGPESLVSHGICGPCAAKLEAEIEEQDEPDERACEAWYKKMEQQGGTK